MTAKHYRWFAEFDPTSPDNIRRHQLIHGHRPVARAERPR